MQNLWNTDTDINDWLFIVLYESEKRKNPDGIFICLLKSSLIKNSESGASINRVNIVVVYFCPKR